MGNRLAGKTASVIGGVTGIGEAISKKFASEGRSVIVALLKKDPCADVVQEIRKAGGSAKSFSDDLSEYKTADDCVNYAVDTHGKLNILIHNAGAFLSKPTNLPVTAKNPWIICFATMSERFSTCKAIARTSKDHSLKRLMEDTKIRH